MKMVFDDLIMKPKKQQHKPLKTPLSNKNSTSKTSYCNEINSKVNISKLHNGIIKKLGISHTDDCNEKTFVAEMKTLDNKAFSIIIRSLFKYMKPKINRELYEELKKNLEKEINSSRENNKTVSPPPQEKARNKNSRNQLNNTISKKSSKKDSERNLKQHVDQCIIKTTYGNSYVNTISSKETIQNVEKPNVAINNFVLDKKSNYKNEKPSCVNNKKQKRTMLKLSIDYKINKDPVLKKFQDKKLSLYVSPKVKSKQINNPELPSKHNLNGFLSYKKVEIPKETLIPFSPIEKIHIESSRFQNFKQLRVLGSKKEANRSLLKPRNEIPFSNDVKKAKSTLIISKNFKNSLTPDETIAECNKGRFQDIPQNSPLDKGSIISSTQTFILTNSTKKNAEIRQRPSEVSINLKDFIDSSMKKLITEHNERSPEELIYFDDAEFSKELISNNKNTIPDKVQHTIETGMLNRVLDQSYENIQNHYNDQEVSNDEDETTQKSEISDKNDFFSHPAIGDKLFKKEILYTNEISFDKAEEKLKNTLFKKS